MKQFPSCIMNKHTILQVSVFSSVALCTMYYIHNKRCKTQAHKNDIKKLVIQDQINTSSIDQSTTNHTKSYVRCNKYTSAIQSWVSNCFLNALKSVSAKMHKRIFLEYVGSKSSSATTILFSPNTWFADLKKNIRQHVSCVNVRVPLTLRLNQAFSHTCLVLDAYVDYEVRLCLQNTTSGTVKATTNTHDGDGTVVPVSYKASQEAIVEDILNKTLFDSQSLKHSVCAQCKISGNTVNHHKLSDLLGMPIANNLVATLSSDVLHSSDWNYDSIHEWFLNVFSRCCRVPNQSNMFTTDRVLYTLHSVDKNDDITDQESCSEDDNDTDLTEYCTHKSFSPQSLSECTVVVVGTVETHTNEDLEVWKKRIVTIGTHSPLSCEWHDNAFYILTHTPDVVLSHLHTDNTQTDNQHTSCTENGKLQTYRFSVQSIGQHSTHSTHITQIEVID